MKNKLKKTNKAFTMIELVVVIAVIGILVLLAMPKFLGYVKEAKMAQIKNDIKAYEIAIESERINNDKFIEEWEDISKESLIDYIHFEKLYDTKGITKKLHENDDKYYKVPSELINSKLKGNFASNKGGKVYYYEGTVKGEIKDEVVVTETLVMNFGKNVNFPDTIVKDGVVLSKKNSPQRGELSSGELKEQDTKYVNGQGEKFYNKNDYKGELDWNPIWGDTKVKDVSAGKYHSLILLENGEVWSTGGNKYGQLGDGTNIDRSVPVKIDSSIWGGSPVSKVSAGFYQTMLLLENGEIWATGENSRGQLGDGTTVNKNKPVKVHNTWGNQKVENIYASSKDGFSAFLLDNGEAWITGGEYSNVNGERVEFYFKGAVKSKTSQDNPGNKIINVDIGHRLHFLLDNGNVVEEKVDFGAWGRPHSLKSIVTWTDKSLIQISYDYVFKGTHYLTNDGRVYTLENNVKQYVFPTWENSKVVNITNSSRNMFFHLDNGDVYAYGERFGLHHGVIGNGVVGEERIDEPMKVVQSWGNKKVANLSTTPGANWTGEKHTLFLIEDGTVYGTGSNLKGQLGDNPSGKINSNQLSSYNNTPFIMGTYHGSITRDESDTRIWEYTQLYEGIKASEDNREWSK